MFTFCWFLHWTYFTLIIFNSSFVILPNSFILDLDLISFWLNFFMFLGFCNGTCTSASMALIGVHCVILVETCTVFKYICSCTCLYALTPMKTTENCLYSQSSKLFPLLGQTVFMWLPNSPLVQFLCLFLPEHRHVHLVFVPVFET